VIIIDIPGKPIPFKSPRVFSRRTFNPLWAEKKQTQSIISEKYTNAPLTCPCYCRVVFYIQVPKSFSKKKKEQALNDQILPTTQIDVDNCSKYLLDCLKGIVFEDDRLVVDLFASKRYANTGHTVVIVKEVQIDQPNI
jgi:Holliday junction resolvase RusA-like endonuclease